MPDLPIIEIFARSPAKAAYLADIVHLAGGQPETAGKSVNKAALMLVAGDAKTFKAPDNAPKILFLGDGDVGEGVRVLKTPLRAAALADILRRQIESLIAVPALIVIGDCTLDTRESLWLAPGQSPLRLTEKETEILRYLKESKNHTMSRQSLLENVWAYAEGVETHTLETHIYRLRQKIEADPSSPVILLTVEDGYKLAG